MKKALLLSLIAVAVVFAGVAVAEDVTVKGTVEKCDEGCAIKADDASYAVAPCKCEEAMPDKCPVCKIKTLVGKKVTVTGAVEEKDGKKVITVSKVEEEKAE